ALDAGRGSFGDSGEKVLPLRFQFSKGNFNLLKGAGVSLHLTGCRCVVLHGIGEGLAASCQLKEVRRALPGRTAAVSIPRNLEATERLIFHPLNGLGNADVPRVAQGRCFNLCYRIGRNDLVAAFQGQRQSAGTGFREMADVTATSAANIDNHGPAVLPDIHRERSVSRRLHLLARPGIC
ncbi:MAG TPA: hypothetical protein VHZ30_07910, partial [Verrucomicrobiae bacterium]|nr:hypothetical protein [Verrucomicrobiae bacterium]